MPVQIRCTLPSIDVVIVAVVWSYTTVNVCLATGVPYLVFHPKPCPAQRVSDNLAVLGEMKSSAPFAHSASSLISVVMHTRTCSCPTRSRWMV